jgi:hypothetical protein
VRDRWPRELKGLLTQSWLVVASGLGISEEGGGMREKKARRAHANAR